MAEGLKAFGYDAVSVPQEHSSIRRLYRRAEPDFLVALDARLDTVRRRRPVPWGQERLDEQLKRLTFARQECHLFLPTDDLTIEEVRRKVAAAVETAQARAAGAGAAHAGTVPAIVAKEDA